MRASRLVSILLLLQARGRMTADELADELEVSVRTIYRDALSLQIAGVPLLAESGHDGGYELSGGYRTNLTGFTTDEAAALFLAGTPGLATELGMGDAASTVRRKLVAALPVEQRQSATRMSRSFHLDAPGWFQHFDRPPHLATVTDAVLAQRRVRVRYSSWERESTKTLEPYGIVQKGGQWYVIATTTRKDSRPSTYRVDHILDIETLDETFSRPDDFDLAAYWIESLRSFQNRLRTGTAVVRMSPNGRAHYQQASREQAVATDRTADGWITAVVPIESIDDAYAMFLRLGADVEIIEPLQLRSRMAATANGMAGLYDVIA
jgi:predicted DNA-binding transcriptional regulator YafY